MPFKRGDIVEYKNKVDTNPMDGAIAVLITPCSVHAWTIRLISAPDAWGKDWYADPFFDECNMVKLTETSDDCST